ncbi:MAG: MFS transporter [Bacteroidia bacterium]|nr:MFS transporter [Bacteroidia bacterium]
MSFGFLGIQFGFGLQAANTSRIFQTYGAEVESLAILTIAAPLTGLFVQPIIGFLSDRTWSPRWGRRKPYFMIGAILATISLIIMPNSSSLYMAVGMLWIMDTAFNVSMEPFRAFVGDLLPSEQRTRGYAMQSVFIGVGAVLASLLPLLFSWFGMSSTGEGEHEVGQAVKWSYYVGAFAFIAAVAWTVFSTKEYPPEEKQFTEDEGPQKPAGIPWTMFQLAVVQFFSWFGLFAMWIYTTPTVATHIFGSGDAATAAYQDGANWVGGSFGVYNGVAAIMGFLIPMIAGATSRKTTHQICLVLGAIGLGSIFLVTDKYLLLLSMVGIGCAWASILSMPYAILVGSLPEKELGLWVGVFNIFIVLPQIVAATILGWLLTHFFDKDPRYAMLIGGVSFLVAALFVFIVKDKDEPNQLTMKKEFNKWI